MGKNLSAVRAPATIKVGSAGGGEASLQPDPDPTVDGWPNKGQADVNAKKGADTPQSGTNMQGAAGNPSCPRAGEQNVSSATAKIAQVKTGNTDF